MAKAGQKVSRDAKCPFYEREDKYRIICKCDLNEQYTASFWFPEGSKTKRPFMKQYCYNLPGYRLCKHYHEE